MVGEILLVLVVIAGVGVTVDSWRLGWRYGTGLPGSWLSPVGWGSIVVLGPVIFIPAYIVCRRRFVRERG